MENVESSGTKMVHQNCPALGWNGWTFMPLPWSVIPGESLLEGRDLGQDGSLKLRQSLKKMAVKAYLLIALPTARGPSPSFLGHMGATSLWLPCFDSALGRCEQEISILSIFCRPSFILAIKIGNYNLILSWCFPPNPNKSQNNYQCTIKKTISRYK